jgi:hypothetical protein
VDPDVFGERQATARRTINALYGTPDGELGPTLFVSHHLDEIEPGYWLTTFGVAQPTPEQILNALVLVSSWSTDRGEMFDTFDFALPGNASNYIIAVRFGGDGQVADVSMES